VCCVVSVSLGAGKIGQGNGEPAKMSKHKQNRTDEDEEIVDDEEEEKKTITKRNVT